jgi:squalene-hopene/tetraprenyl-beta-curcumene cyclase
MVIDPVVDSLDAQAALVRACTHLLSLQDTAGWWKGDLQTNVTMDAEDIMLRQFLGVPDADATERATTWIHSQQQADGSWSNFFGGPGDLSTTIEAYLALRLASHPPNADHMRAAREFVRGAGGLDHARVFTHIWLALFGLWPWGRVPAVVPEMMMLPRWAPLNVYDFACWARQTVVALSVVRAYRPRRPLPFSVDELRGAGEWPMSSRRPCAALALMALDRVLGLYDQRRRAGSGGLLCRGRSDGSSIARRRMARGVGYSRRGCTR